MAIQLRRHGHNRLVPDVPGYTPSRDELEIYASIEECHRAAEPSHTLYEKTWLYTMSFILGHQYLSWDDVSWQLVYRPEPRRRRIRETRNKMRAAIERRLATLTAGEPVWGVRPNSTDVEDQQGASVGRRVAQHYWRLLDMMSLRQELIYWVLKTGNGFLKPFWDPTSGESWVDWDVDEDGMPVVVRTPEGELKIRERRYALGDVRIEVVDPFCIFVDPTVPRMEDQERLVEIDRRPIQWLERQYPDKAPWIRADGGRQDRRLNYRNLFHLVSPGAFRAQGAFTHQLENEWVTVRKLYERPSVSFPRGRYAVEGAGVILEYGDNPTPNADIPFVHFQDLPVAGRFFGQAMAEHMITPQRNYNRLCSGKIEHVMTTARAKVLMPKVGSMIPQSHWDDRIGEFIWHTPQYPPTYLAPPPLPKEADEEMARIDRDLDEITMTYGVEKGVYQGRASGRALDILAEQGIHAKEPTIVRHSIGFAKVGRMVLELFQEHASEERIIKTIGRRNQFDVAAFSGADLRGNTDCFVELDSIMPRSKALALNEVQVLASVGLLNMQNPAHQAKAWRILQGKSEEDIVDEEVLDRDNAAKENRLMSLGQPVMPQWFENHDIHMEEHTLFMNTDEFKALPPERQMLFEAHTQATGQLALPQPGVTLSPEDQAFLESPAPAEPAGASSTEE